MSGSQRRERLARYERKRRRAASKRRRRRCRLDKPSRVAGSQRTSEEIAAQRAETGYTEVLAPSDLSIQHGLWPSLRFFERLEQLHKQKRSVWVSMRNVRHLGYGAIAVLLSTMVKFQVNGVRFNGDMPRKRRVRKRIIASGFFDALYKPNVRSDRYEFGKGGALLTHAERRVDPKLAQHVVHETSRALFGEVRKLPMLYATLIELMTNTRNHASPPLRAGERHWWLSMERDTLAKTVYFAFVDLGVGILRSLEGRGAEKGMLEWREWVKTVAGVDQNHDILRLLFEGMQGRSATELPFRGKGLPKIFEAMKANALAELAVVSNDAFGDVSAGGYELLPTAFEGTIYVWKVTQACPNIVRRSQ